MKVFEKNNHSKYRIGWEKVDSTRSDGIKNLILENYDIDYVAGNIAQVKEWERMSNNFRVNVKMRGKWRKVLFRKNIRLQDEGSVAISNKIADFLKGKKIPVPAVVPTKEGRAFFRAGQHFYEMHDFISGNHYRGTRKELEKAARGIAKLHKALNQIPFKKEIEKKGNSLAPWTMEIWNDVFSRAESRDSDIDKAVIENRDLIFGEIEKIEKAREQVKKLKRQIIHADLHPQNTIFDKEKLVAIIDFEGAREGELLRDIGNACHRFVRQFVVYQRKDFHKTLGEGIRIFLEEYSKINPIKEKSIISLLISDELLRKLQSDIGTHYFESNSSRVEGGELEKKLTLLKESEIIETFIK